MTVIDHRMLKNRLLKENNRVLTDRNGQNTRRQVKQAKFPSTDKKTCQYINGCPIYTSEHCFALK